MLSIDTSDCRLEIGVGRKFMCSLVWHFARFLRDRLSPKRGMVDLDAETIEGEARRLALRFTGDMQEYFRRTLSDSYETLDHLSPEGIVDLYIQENLADFEADYVMEQLSDFRIAHSRSPIASVHLSASPESSARH